MTVSAVIGRNVRQLRGSRSQDEVAAGLRILGLAWSQPVIAAIEAGARSLDIAEVALVAYYLGVGFPALLGGDGTVDLTATAHMALEDLRRTVSQESTIGTGINLDPPDWLTSASRGVTEQRAAKRLGVTPRAVTTMAFKMWGHSLTEERDRRTADLSVNDVTPSSRQAFRGRVTRQLDAELADRLKGDS